MVSAWLISLSPLLPCSSAPLLPCTLALSPLLFLPGPLLLLFPFALFLPFCPPLGDHTGSPLQMPLLLGDHGGSPLQLLFPPYALRSLAPLLPCSSALSPLLLSSPAPLHPYVSAEVFSPWICFGSIPIRRIYRRYFYRNFAFSQLLNTGSVISYLPLVCF